MFRNFSIRWALIGWFIGSAANPFIFNKPAELTHIGWALLALFLILTAPKPETKEK